MLSLTKTAFSLPLTGLYGGERLLRAGTDRAGHGGTRRLSPRQNVDPEAATGRREAATRGVSATRSTSTRTVSPALRPAPPRASRGVRSPQQAAGSVRRRHRSCLAGRKRHLRPPPAPRKSPARPLGGASGGGGTRSRGKRKRRGAGSGNAAEEPERSHEDAARHRPAAAARPG